MSMTTFIFGIVVVRSADIQITSAPTLSASEINFFRVGIYANIMNFKTGAFKHHGHKVFYRYHEDLP